MGACIASAEGCVHWLHAANADIGYAARASGSFKAGQGVIVLCHTTQSKHLCQRKLEHVEWQAPHNQKYG